MKPENALTGDTGCSTRQQIHGQVIVRTNASAARIALATILSGLWSGILIVAVIELRLAAVQNVFEGISCCGLSRRLLVLILILSIMRLLPLGTVFALLDVDEDLACLVLAGTRVNVFPSQSTNHALEDVADLGFKVVLVVVRPV